MNRDGPRHLRQAESPDEGEFVSFARNLGFFFCRRLGEDGPALVEDLKGLQDLIGERHDRDVLAACKRVSRAHRITTDDGYKARCVRAMHTMAAEINASGEPLATVLCAVLLDQRNDRSEPESAASRNQVPRAAGSVVGSAS